MSHQHVPSSSFHQVNKGHSGGKHDSKGAIRKRQKGKVSSAGGENRGSVKSLSKVLSKSDKKAVQQQYSKNKKLAVLERKRFGTAEGAPKIVALISLGELDLTKMQHMLLSHLGKTPEELESLVSSCTISLNTKQRMTLVKVPRETNAILDIAKVADILLLVVPADEGIDELGDQFISLIKAQGLPNVFGIVEGLDNIPEKKRHETKKEYIKILHQYFPGEPRVLPFDNATDAGQVIRFVENCTVHPVHWREKRPYVLVQNVSSDEGEKEVGTIKVTGYLRGANMSANQLVHIPGYGDFQLKKIQVLNDPHPIGRPKDAPELGESEIKSVEPDNKQESLVTENVPDLLLNEQTWPTPEELSGKKKVPKGTSAYQASWIVDEEDRAAHENHDEEGDENMDDEEHAEAREEDDEDDEEEEEIDMDEKTQKGEDDEDDSTTITEASRADRSTRQESDLMYPDEVDCPIDTPARLRFQKYRGLKSFRTTTWDPKENLPLDYARIFQFANFNRSMNNAMETSEFPVPVGTYVTLHIANVPMEYLHAYTKNPERPLAIGGLFKYENKMSVLQFHILKHQTYEDPVQSKDTLVFHVGMRRYTVQPIFSTINPGCAKQKFERFLQPGRPSCATIYGPATFPPNPLLVFTTSGELVATGTLHAVDPDRIVVKKIVITGTPAKVHKRGAVIRDMFYFPEDANWFRPVELWTKNGKVGHIKESVGTHGLIKCTFDTPVNQNDTVCLSLYKRVFPKWPKISPSAQFVKNDSKSTTETEMEN